VDLGVHLISVNILLRKEEGFYTYTPQVCISCSYAYNPFPSRFEYESDLKGELPPIEM
jgi:hypothetical protein